MDKEIKHWFVSTPEYRHNYGYWEPPEWFADYVCVEAPTKKEARRLGFQLLKKDAKDWIDDQRSDNVNPFAGLIVKDARCEHGNCWCDNCPSKPEWVECPECMKKWEQEYETSELVESS
jgi:hypothetical protein